MFGDVFPGNVPHIALVAFAFEMTAAHDGDDSTITDDEARYLLPFYDEIVVTTLNEALRAQGKDPALRDQMQAEYERHHYLFSAFLVHLRGEHLTSLLQKFRVLPDFLKAQGRYVWASSRPSPWPPITPVSVPCEIEQKHACFDTSVRIYLMKKRNFSNPLEVSLKICQKIEGRELCSEL